MSEIKHENILFRINGAHGNSETIKRDIEKIRTIGGKILIDLPGNKIRTANFEYGFIEVERGERFEIFFDNFNYKEFYKHIEVGDVVLANDSIFRFEVVDIDMKKRTIVFLSHSTGKLLSNKGFHIKGVSKDLPFLFEKDKELIALANEYEIDFVGLSFVRNAQDVQTAKELVKNSTIIAKVETLSAVENLDDILEEVEYILIDRGDLSTDVGLLEVPYFQQKIIKKAQLYNKKVFLATQFLKSMEENPIPTFPEIIDLYNSLNSGIYGIQLSEENAIGKYPKECLDIAIETIRKLQDD